MTTIPSSERARIQAYDYAAPSEADALAALQRVFGPARGVEVWTRACVDAGLAAGAVTGSADVSRATDSLARQGGAAATVARAIAIRMRTFDRLAARAAGTGASR